MANVGFLCEGCDAENPAMRFKGIRVCTRCYEQNVHVCDKCNEPMMPGGINACGWCYPPDCKGCVKIFCRVCSPAKRLRLINHTDYDGDENVLYLRGAEPLTREDIHSVNCLRLGGHTARTLASEFAQLQQLYLSFCNEIVVLDAIPTLEKLAVAGCAKLKIIRGEFLFLKEMELSTPHLTTLAAVSWRLTSLELNYCRAIDYVSPCLFKRLEKLCISGDFGSTLTQRALAHVATRLLRRLDLDGSNVMTDLALIGRLVYLEHLTIGRFHEVMHLDGMERLVRLRELKIWMCGSLKTFSVPMALKCLEVMICDALEQLPSKLAICDQLEHLCVMECSSLHQSLIGKHEGAALALVMSRIRNTTDEEPDMKRARVC